MTSADENPKVAASAEAAFVLLAEAYVKEGFLEDAVRICRSGLDRFPTSWSGRIFLGKILLAQGAVEAAYEELDYVRRQAGGSSEVMAALEDALQGAPAPSGEQEVRAEPGVLILDSPADAITPQYLPSETPSRDPLATPTLATLYASQGDTERADAILRELARSDGFTMLSGASSEDQQRQRYLGRLVALREAVRQQRRTRLS